MPKKGLRGGKPPHHLKRGGGRGGTRSRDDEHNPREGGHDREHNSIVGNHRQRRGSANGRGGTHSHRHGHFDGHSRGDDGFSSQNQNLGVEHGSEHLHSSIPFRGRGGGKVYRRSRRQVMHEGANGIQSMPNFRGRGDELHSDNHLSHRSHQRHVQFISDNEEDESSEPQWRRTVRVVSTAPGYAAYGTKQENHCQKSDHGQKLNHRHNTMRDKHVEKSGTGINHKNRSRHRNEPNKSSNAPNGTQSNGNSLKPKQRVSKKNKKPQYEEFLDETSVQAGLDAAMLFVGQLRINPRRRTDGYVTVPGISKDIFVNSVKDRNRALERDVVCVRLLPISEWKSSDKPSDDSSDDSSEMKVVYSELESKQGITNELDHDHTPKEAPSDPRRVQSTADKASITSSSYASSSEAIDKLWHPVIDTTQPLEKIFNERLSHIPNQDTADISTLTPLPWTDPSEKNLFSSNSHEEYIKMLQDYSDISADPKIVSLGEIPSSVCGVDVPLNTRLLQHINFIRRVIQKTGLQPVGSVVRVLKQQHSRFVVGLLKAVNGEAEDMRDQDSFLRVVPLDNRMPFIMIQRKDAPKDFAKIPKKYNATLLECKIVRWGHTSIFPLGKIVRVLGNAGKIEVETSALLATHGIHEEPFSSEVLQCLDKFSHGGWSVTEKDLSVRRDYRNHRIFTIDPSSARDLDDALHVQEVPDSPGVYEIGVHIADVSHFIEKATALDEEASRRATSVYLVQRVIPMLPRLLCEELCSLNPNVERLAFSCVWRMNDQGEIIGTPWFGRSVINACAKLDYEIAQNFLENKITAEMVNTADKGDHDAISHELWPLDRRPEGGHSMSDVRNDVLILHKIAKKRRAERYYHGAVSLNRVKLSVERDEEGLPKRLFIYPIRDSNRLIEEYMLLANYLVAQELVNRVGPHAVLRNHPSPLIGQAQDLAEDLRRHGFDFSWQDAKTLHESLEGIRKSASAYATRLAQSFVGCSGNPSTEEKQHAKTLTENALISAIESMVMRPMKPAQYFVAGSTPPESWKHYALAIPYYTHFTSPIRRYADVMVHRLLQAALDNEDEDRLNELVGHIDELNDQCAICNDRKYAAKQAGDACDLVYFCIYLHSNPITTTAIVTEAGGPNHFSVVVPEWGVERKIFVDELGAEGVYDEEQHIMTMYPLTENELAQRIEARKRGQSQDSIIKDENRPQFAPKCCTIQVFQPLSVKLVARMDKIPLKFDVQLLALEQWDGPVFKAQRVCED